MPLQHLHRRVHTRGFSLVEVLVSIVIFSFGLLGMVGLQASAIQANRDARLQSLASNLGREMAEMMRGNPDISIEATATANPYLLSLTAPLTPTNFEGCLFIGSTCGATLSPSSASNVTTNNANNLKLARAQVTEWLARVDEQLPGARVVICFDNAPFAAGLPVWDCTGTAANGVATVKLGWTRNPLNRGSGASNTPELASAAGSSPGVVIPVAIEERM